MARQSPTGSLLAERRLPPQPDRAPEPALPSFSAKRLPVAVPDLELRPVETRSPAGPWLLSVSTLLHAGLVVAVIVVPLLARDTLPAPASAVQVFFAEPLEVPA